MTHPSKLLRFAAILMCLAYLAGTPLLRSQTREETSLWQSIKDSKNAEDYKGYLDKYPEGAYAPVAKRRITQLEAHESEQGPEAQSETGKDLSWLTGSWEYSVTVSTNSSNGSCTWEETTTHLFNLSATGTSRHIETIAERLISRPPGDYLGICRSSSKRVQFKATIAPGKKLGTASFEDDSDDGNRANLEKAGSRLKITYDSGVVRFADPK
jgi:hypothetical protein